MLKKELSQKIVPLNSTRLPKCIWMHEKCLIFSVLYLTIFGKNTESYKLNLRKIRKRKNSAALFMQWGMCLKGFHNTRPYTMSNKVKYKVFLCFSILTNAEFHEHHPLVFYRITILEHFLKFTGKHLQSNPKIGCAQNSANWKISNRKTFFTQWFLTSFGIFQISRRKLQKNMFKI